MNLYLEIVFLPLPLRATVAEDGPPGEPSVTEAEETVETVVTHVVQLGLPFNSRRLTSGQLKRIAGTFWLHLLY